MSSDVMGVFETGFLAQGENVPQPTVAPLKFIVSNGSVYFPMLHAYFMIHQAHSTAHSTAPALAHPGNTSELELTQAGAVAVACTPVPGPGPNTGIENNDLVLRVESKANRLSEWTRLR